MSEITERVIGRIRELYEAGLRKYGTTMDSRDLPPSEWVAHAQEELLDGARYLERLRGMAVLMEDAVLIMHDLKDGIAGSDAASGWLRRYYEKFR